MRSPKAFTEELESRLEALKAEYEAKITRLTTQYPQLIARRLAEGLLKASASDTVAQLLEKAESWEGPAFEAPAAFEIPAPTADTPAPVAAVAAAPAAAVAAPAADEEMTIHGQRALYRYPSLYFL